MKSENEIALEEKEKLEKLEADRLKRMHSYDVSSETSNANANRLRSADDLDDGYFFFITVSWYFIDSAHSIYSHFMDKLTWYNETITIYIIEFCNYSYVNLFV